MEPIDLPTIFISYSRQQLYFAEALTLHLQQAGLDVWFDLQQLKAGSVWSDGLREGIGQAGKLVLVVSRASLASSFVEEEWRGVLESGNPIVLAVFESVELPEELRGLPTYDFRRSSVFKSKLGQLIDFLKGEAPAIQDNISPPSRFRDSFKTPLPVVLIVLAFLTTPLACAIMVSQLYVVQSWWLLFAVIATGIGIWYLPPFLRGKQVYRKVRRSILWLTLLLFLQGVLFAILIGFDSLFNPVTDKTSPLSFEVIRTVTFLGLIHNLFVYYLVFGRSSQLLRWMRPDDDLQVLRRRVHVPLITKAQVSLDQDVANRRGESFSFSLHHTSADHRAAKWIVDILKSVGHEQVEVQQGPMYHIVVLSNQTPLALVQSLLSVHAGQLIFVMISSLKLSDQLQEAGKYQWVDARDLDEQDILGLASSLGTATAGKEAAIESTPTGIEDLTIPPSLRLLRAILVLVAMIGLYRILAEFVVNLFSDNEFLLLDRNPNFNPYLVVLSTFLFIGSFWLIIQGVLKRRITAFLTYAVTFLLCFLACFIVFPSFKDEFAQTDFVSSIVVVFFVIFLLLVSSAQKGYVWLPASSHTNVDRLGVARAPIVKWQKRYIVIVLFWAILWLTLSLVEEFLRQ